MLRIASIAFLLATLPAPAADVTFRDEPISCGNMPGWSKCLASFDGWTLVITYSAQDGRKAEASYRQCVAQRDLIACSAGQWRAGRLTGALEPRAIGLRDGKPHHP